MDNLAFTLNEPFTPDHYHQATIYSGLGKHDKAIINYSKVIELQPDFAEAYYERGLMYQQIGCYREAKLDFLRYLDLMPDGENRDKVLLMLARGHTH